MGLFNLLKKALNTAPVKSTPEPFVPQTGTTNHLPKKEEKHRIAGTSFKQNEIKSLGVLNPNYQLNKSQLIKKNLINITVYEYTFNSFYAELIPEPTNEHDPNAIMVMIAGKHVGYIKKGSCAHVKKLINANSIKSITAIMKGGNTKYVSCFDLEDRDKSSYEYEASKGDIGIEITIHTI